MLTKCRFFAALLTVLLLSASALAEIDLKPYEIESARFSAVEILAPDVYLVLHDGIMNGGQLPTALVLLDHGQKVFEQYLPDYADNSEFRTFYALFVANKDRYGLMSYDNTSFTRFQLLENGVLSEGFSLSDRLSSSSVLPDGPCILRKQDDLYLIEHLDWSGALLSSTPISAIESTLYSGFTVLNDKSIAYIAYDIGDSHNPCKLYHLRLSPDGEPFSSVPVSLPNANFIPSGAFSPNGGTLSYTTAKLTKRREPYFSFLACSDAEGHLLFAEGLKAKNVNIIVHQAVAQDDGSATVYGIVERDSQNLFRAFKLELDASGRILSRDVRDFTTRAGDQYQVQLDPLGNAYVVADDYEHPIAIVPFEALPPRDDIELILE